MKRYYIAYGSNLNIRQMRIRCPHARVIGTAVINDYELLFKGSRTGAYLTIEPKEGGEVPVAVWEVTESDETALDRYEGYPVFYYKKEMELDIRGIRTGKIRRRKCFVYIMHEERKIGVPSLSYVSTCLWGFSFDLVLCIMFSKYFLLAYLPRADAPDIKFHFFFVIKHRISFVAVKCRLIRLRDFPYRHGNLTAFLWFNGKIGSRTASFK